MVGLDVLTIFIGRPFLAPGSGRGKRFAVGAQVSNNIRSVGDRLGKTADHL